MNGERSAYEAYLDARRVVARWKPVDEFEPADPCPYHGRDDEVDELERLLLDSQRENELLRGKVWRLEVEVADLIAERETAGAVAMTAEERRLAMFGEMEVISSDQGAGRLYRCACGWSGWSSWGHARKHARACPQSGRKGEIRLVPGRPSA